MITYLLLALTLGLAALSIFLMNRASRKPPADLVFTAVLSAFLALFIYLYGMWVYCSIYLKYVFGVLFLLSTAWFFFRRQQTLRGRSVWPKFFFIVLLGIAVVLYFTGTTGRPKTVELDFPLKKGRYFVLQGGKGLPTNLFHFSLRGAIYAMDIVKLNDFGNRANTVFSRDLEDYAIFGDTVYSPCSGKVVRAYSDNPDNIPPNMDRGPKNTNMVVIEGDHYTVFMGPLKMGSVMVKEGDMVKTGQPLGCVGNSGFSTEPHLHIQVHELEEGKRWYNSTPLYIRFNGRSYLLTEMIKKKNL
ncbi:MAG: M23 family metallopeptidase [Chitinophaga sp.]